MSDLQCCRMGEQVSNVERTGLACANRVEPILKGKAQEETFIHLSEADTT